MSLQPISGAVARSLRLLQSYRSSDNQVAILAGLNYGLSIDIPVRRGQIVTDLQMTTDRNLFEAIHRVLEAERNSVLQLRQEQSNRRTGPRHPYRCRQLIGPIVDGRLPSQSQFFHVQCDDLSSGGMAYLADDMVTTDELIIALGTVPFLFLRARILRQEQVIRDGNLVYRIACRFIGRIDNSPTPDMQSDFAAR
jgi:hypothetical protein